MKIVFDTYAWIEYLKGSEAGAKARSILESPENEVFTSIMTVSELTSKLQRENNDAELGYKIIKDMSKICFISLELAKEAGMLHAEIRKKVKDFGMIDSILLSTAHQLD